MIITEALSVHTFLLDVEKNVKRLNHFFITPAYNLNINSSYDFHVKLILVLKTCRNNRILLSDCCILRTNKSPPQLNASELQL